MTTARPARPGAAWEAELLRVEQVVPPEDAGCGFSWFDPAPRTTIDGMNEPSPPLINRRTRRGLRRKERKNRA